MKPLKKILVPVDFSATSRAALDRALDLARIFDGSVTLLHAYQFPPYELTDQTVKEITRAAEDSLKVLAKELLGSHVPIDSRAVPGAPAEAIVQFAKTQEADLIVMGNHGRTGLKHMIIGSVTEKVVRHATCAVLTIKG